MFYNNICKQISKRRKTFGRFVTTDPLIHVFIKCEIFISYKNHHIYSVCLFFCEQFDVMIITEQTGFHHHKHKENVMYVFFIETLMVLLTTGDTSVFALMTSAYLLSAVIPL